MRLVVEADGGSRGNPGPAAYGALVRDADTGAVLAETAEAFGTATNNVAEYRGLVAGLRLAAELDPDPDVEVRMDSKLVVEQMAGRWKIKHPDLRPLAREAGQVLPGGVAAWTWVPRERNRRADTLVNAALDGKLDEVLEHPVDAPTRRPAASPAPQSVPPPSADARSGQQAAFEMAAQPVVQPVPPAAARPEPSRPEPSRTGSAPTASATTLVLLRHGRTADNAARRFSGPRGADPGLDEVGRHQAAVVAAALADAGIGAVVSSPMRRARETAAVVAGALGLDVSIDPAFTDFDPGEWDGATSDEVRRAFPAWHAAWSVSPDVTPPDGESVRSVQARVLEGVRGLVRRHPGRRVLVVAHAVPIGCALTAALEAPLTSALRLAIANGSASVVRYPADGPPRTEAVALPPGTVLSA